MTAADGVRAAEAVRRVVLRQGSGPRLAEPSAGLATVTGAWSTIAWVGPPTEA